MRYFASSRMLSRSTKDGCFFDSRAETAHGLMRAATKALGEEPADVYPCQVSGIITTVEFGFPVTFDWEFNAYY